MAALEIPKSPDSLSAEWLTAALQGSGAGNASIASFEYEPIAAGVGFLGKLGRLRLQYADGREGLPRTLICKLPTLDEKSRQLAMMFRFYEREVSSITRSDRAPAFASRSCIMAQPTDPTATSSC